jgi:anaerobic magnesium-protoporphyrin IX monomethyl ester cyclase
MKVLLINPPTDTVIASEVPGHVTQEVGSFPPLGLMYLAGALRADGKHEPVLLDLAVGQISPQQLAPHLTRIAPDLVGITAITHNLVGVRRVAQAVKDHNPQLPVCIGGPHVNAFGAQALSLPCFDYALSGEGETTLGLFLDALTGSAPMETVPGIHYRKDGVVTSGASARYEEHLDSLPFPARDLVRGSDYFYVLGKKATFATIIASRGCPFQCTFCSTPHGGYRTRSPDNIVDEVEECLATGAQEIHFVDDTFNLGKRRLADISEALIRRNIKCRWAFRGRADGVDDEGMQLAAQAGCIRIHLGVETGTDEGLVRLKKGVTLHQMERAVRLAARYGIVSAAYFILGCPHERTVTDVERTIRFAIRLDPDFAMFNLLAIYPNTSLCIEAVEKGLVAPDLWSEFIADPNPDFAIPLWEEHLDRQTLQDLLKQSYRRFYLRPRPIWRNLKNLSSISELRRKVHAGLSILLGRS